MKEINSFVKRPEVLSPAGDKERLMAAVSFGADAVYLAGQAFGMRTSPNNFSEEEIVYELGAKRVILARELTLEEIATIRAKTDRDLELEVFVHGSMCVSFSGRCLLSSYLTGRDANRGDCAQPCRWKYSLVEENREGQHFSIMEENNGVYILNSRDLCMINHIPEIINAGATSLKIEGRAKSAYYVATTTNAYRNAVDLNLSANPIAPSISEE